jgi:hypothetical protein
MMQAAAIVILSAGAVGYLVAFGMVVRLRLWLGRRGAGWPKILLNSLVFLLLLLALLFVVSLANNLRLTRHLPYAERLLISFGAAIALTLAPWVLVFALWLWRRQAERGDA